MSSNRIGERVRKDAIALCQDLVSQERADSVGRSTSTPWPYGWRSSRFLPGARFVQPKVQLQLGGLGFPFRATFDLIDINHSSCCYHASKQGGAELSLWTRRFESGAGRKYQMIG